MDKNVLFEPASSPYKNLLMKIDNEICPLPNHNIFSSHWHERMEILHVTKGTLVVKLSNSTLTATPGDTVIINPCQIHSGFSGSDGVSYHIILFESRMLQGSSIDICHEKYLRPLFAKFLQFNNLVHNDEITELISEIMSENQKHDYGCELIIKSDVYKMLAVLFRNYICQNNKLITIDNITEEILEYIDNNLSSKLTTDDVAKHFSFNKSYFCRKFKKQTGTNFIDYVTGKRLELAGTLLSSTTQNISQIASSVGFCDVNYFARKFHERYGVSPTESRRESNKNQR